MNTNRQNEIATFNASCETQRRENGYYVKHQDLADWSGPYESSYDALKFYRLVFMVE